MLNKKHIFALACVAILISTIVNTAIVFGSQIYTPVTISIPVSYQDKKDSTGIIVTLASKNGSPLPEVTELHMSDKEDKSFELRFDEPGFYQYEITYNRNPSVKEQVELTYTAEIYVSDKDSTLHAEEVIYKQGEESKSEDCTFLNVKRGGVPDVDDEEQNENERKSNKNKKPVGQNRYPKPHDRKNSRVVTVSTVRTGDDKDLTTLFILLGVSIIFTALFSRRKQK